MAEALKDECETIFDSDAGNKPVGTWKNCGRFYHHSRFEVVSITKMLQMVEIIKEIVRTDG